VIAFTTRNGVILVNRDHIITAHQASNGNETVLGLTNGNALWVTQDLDTVSEWLS
jgi:hypothetical protein